ncbi:MBL fold metallo-hydrolase [Parabacteroides pacaensis]|uniref:MBL fold metallo-hydrolase n=1 Tax=Parabacteroides pacaensis TaxID=2086575 RepID=UPI000D10C573|nr:MBL fold metallo-hydrolase [Parabacteroides pacaensis]
MEVKFIEAGKFFADGGAMFGAIPKTAWDRRYPCDRKNGCILTMRCALIMTDDGRVILIDTGAGDKQLAKLSYYRFFDLKDIAKELSLYGISCEDVTDVVLTHLHFDHCGYVTRKNEKSGELSLAFPRATYWVSNRQWENFLHPHPLEKDSYFHENLLLVRNLGLLQLVNSDTELCRDVSLRLYDGHTPGQLVPYINMPDQTFVFAGDVIPLVASVSPEWISAYDVSPLVSYNEKIRMLEEAVIKKQRIIYCHDAYVESSEIKKLNSFYKAVNITGREENA